MATGIGNKLPTSSETSTINLSNDRNPASEIARRERIRLIDFDSPLWIDYSRIPESRYRGNGERNWTNRYGEIE